MSKPNKILGKEGEAAAVEYLKNKGYKIRTTNWRTRRYELDIIAEHNDFLVIVEVKSRSGTYFQQPFQAVNKKKQRFIISATNEYIDKFEIDLETRFDIISMVVNGKSWNIEHIEDAFYPQIK